MLEKSVIRKNNAETARTIHPCKSGVNLFYQTIYHLVVAVAAAFPENEFLSIENGAPVLRGCYLSFS